jgi:hypothetical protein
MRALTALGTLVRLAVCLAISQASKPIAGLTMPIIWLSECLVFLCKTPYQGYEKVLFLTSTDFRLRMSNEPGSEFSRVPSTVEEIIGGSNN